MSTKKRIPTPDPVFPHVAVGPSNEEMIQRQAEAEQRRADSGFPKVEFVADAHDKTVEGWGDLEYDPLGLTDPLAKIKSTYQRPGFALKALSDSVTNKFGKRDYRIVKDQDGDPVRFGNMVIGEIPEPIAAARRRAAIVKSDEELRGIKDANREAVEKLKYDARGMGLKVLEDGENVSNIGNGQDYLMGLSVDRGEG